MVSAAERTVPGKDCTWEGSYQPRADCTWNFITTKSTNPKARHLQVQSARGAGEVSTLSEKTNVRERLGPERTVPGKTVPEFLTSGTVNLVQVQSAQELYLGLQFSLKPEVEVRPGEVQSAHAPILRQHRAHAGILNLEVPLPSTFSSPYTSTPTFRVLKSLAPPTR